MPVNIVSSPIKQKSSRPCITALLPSISVVRLDFGDAICALAEPSV